MWRVFIGTASLVKWGSKENCSEWSVDYPAQPWHWVMRWSYEICTDKTRLRCKSKSYIPLKLSTLFNVVRDCKTVKDLMLDVISLNQELIKWSTESLPNPVIYSWLALPKIFQKCHILPWGVFHNEWPVWSSRCDLQSSGDKNEAWENEAFRVNEPSQYEWIITKKANTHKHKITPLSTLNNTLSGTRMLIKALQGCIST